MEKTVSYKYILDNFGFRVPQNKNEYTTSFEDFNITISFKNEEINPIIAKRLVKALKEIKHIDFINRNAKKNDGHT
jgi:hypothetical protein